MTDRYRGELLPNGLVSVFDYGAKTSFLINPQDWTFRTTPPVEPYRSAILAEAKRCIG